MRQYVTDIEIVAFVRHPVDWTRSVTQERLKAGETLEQQREKARKPNWRQRLSPWVDCFGLDKVRIIAYEEAVRNGGILQSFTSFAKIPDDVTASLSHFVSTNQSMSMEAAIILSSLNRQRPLFENGRRSEKRRWPGIDAIMTIPGHKFQLPTAMAQKAREESRADLAWLNATFSVSLYDDIFVDTALSPDDNEFIGMPAETADALAILLSNLGNQMVGLRSSDS